MVWGVSGSMNVRSWVQGRLEPSGGGLTGSLAVVLHAWVCFGLEYCRMP